MITNLQGGKTWTAVFWVETA